MEAAEGRRTADTAPVRGRGLPADGAPGRWNSQPPPTDIINKRKLLHGGNRLTKLRGRGLSRSPVHSRPQAGPPELAPGPEPGPASPRAERSKLSSYDEERTRRR